MVYVSSNGGFGFVINYDLIVKSENIFFVCWNIDMHIAVPCVLYAMSSGIFLYRMECLMFM